MKFEEIDNAQHAAAILGVPEADDYLLMDLCGRTDGYIRLARERGMRLLGAFVVEDGRVEAALNETASGRRSRAISRVVPPPDSASLSTGVRLHEFCRAAVSVAGPAQLGCASQNDSL